MPDVPEGFAPLFRTSPFLDTVGPFYQRAEGDKLIVGLRIAQQHTNSRGTAHGGLLVTLADIALGYNASFLGNKKEAGATPTALLTTASLTTDFVGNAKLGDWVEAHVDVQKVGRHLAFANAYLVVKGERIAHVSGVFAVISKSAP